MHLMTAAAVLVPMVAMAHGISEADRQSMLDGGYLRYIGLGASHMLTGYDHPLFLFGVVFFLTGFKDVAKFVTVFTIGHCITLIFATFYKITWNYYLVDAIIALSVIHKGFDNNGGFQKYFQMASPNLLAAVSWLHGEMRDFGSWQLQSRRHTEQFDRQRSLWHAYHRGLRMRVIT